MESELIAYLRHRLPSHPLLRLGPGDDAAVLRTADVDDCVMTVDLLTDHVDFELAEIDPRRAGRKALAVNLSDLAAMAARPLAAVVALALPRRGGRQLATALYEGLLPLAERYDVAVAGGDTNSWDGPLAVSITLLGEVSGHGPLRRGGAQPGDRIVVTGRFGGSILGRHLDFEPPSSRPCCSTSATSCTPASTSATGCRSTWPTWSKKATAGRCYRPTPCRWPTMPTGWPCNWPTAPHPWNTPWATARISSCCWPFPPTRPKGCWPNSRWTYRWR